MSWFRHLDQIAGTAPSSVGYGAYYLAQLRQGGLPVADGWVLPQDMWQTALAHIATELPHRPLHRHLLDLEAGQDLQVCSQAWQKALEQWFADPGLTLNEQGVPDWGCPCSPWVMRPSLWLASGSAIPHRSLYRMLPDVVGAEPGIWPCLQQCWQQALKARSLLVWQQHCQGLAQVGMGTLLLPLYPARVSGRLTLKAGTIYIEAVEGMALALTRGEAIPARCTISLQHSDQFLWQPGHQERGYWLVPAAPAEPSHPGDGKTPLQKDAGTQVLQVTDRSRETLAAPLSEEQVAELVQLAQQARDILVAHGFQGDHHHANGSVLREAGVELEWALYPSPESSGLAWMITQVTPWESNAADQPPTHDVTTPTPLADRSLLSPPPLPQVSVVVKGVGASSGRVRARAVVAQNPQLLPEPLPEGCIVVLPDLQPDRFLQMASVAGIVTEQGGATCHAAILAREMGIPAVVGAPQATYLIESDLMLWLDGERGLVYGIGDDGQAQVWTAQSAFDKPEPPVPSPSAAPVPPGPQGMWPLNTKVMVNLSQSRRVSDLPLQQIDGIGLLRSEWLMLEILDRRHPWHWIHQGQEVELQTRLAQALEPILQTLGEKPVRYRTLDLRSHEWQSLEGSPTPDSNPMLGLRGALSYTIDARLFEMELGALATLQRAGYHNLHLMLPFVRSVEEVIACRRYIDLAELSQVDGFALWMMAEVPSVLFLLPAYAKAGVQGIAIGSNDLTQLLLAVDRDQPTMASAYDERHVVVQMALAHLIREARRCGMTCSICGQAPARYPELIADLVAWGIDSISVEMGALPFTREAVWRAEQTANTPSSSSLGGLP
jgi:pyruvate,water dikinase